MGLLAAGVNLVRVALFILPAALFWLLAVVFTVLAVGRDATRDMLEGIGE